MIVIILVKFIIPSLTIINVIFYFIGEFSDKTAKSRGWGPGITWLGRLLWIIPIGLAFIGTCVNVKMADIYVLVEKQHGIKFNNTRMGDHTYELTSSAVEMKEETQKQVDEIEA